MKVLTIIFSDYSPLQCAGEPIKYRSIHIPFTEDQLKMLNPKQTHTIEGRIIFEDISQCFIEEIF